MPNKPLPFRDARAAAQRLAGEMNIEFVDAELVKEPAGLFMRFYIEKPGGGITLDELETYHRALLPMVKDAEYDYMEVSSPGADRPLKTERDFERAMGTQVELKLYRALNGKKEFRGTLTDYADGKVTLSEGETDSVFDVKDTAYVRPVIEVDEDEMAAVLDAAETGGTEQ